MHSKIQRAVRGAIALALACALAPAHAADATDIEKLRASTIQLISMAGGAGRAVARARRHPDRRGLDFCIGLEQSRGAAGRDRRARAGGVRVDAHGQRARALHPVLRAQGDQGRAACRADRAGREGRPGPALGRCPSGCAACSGTATCACARSTTTSSPATRLRSTSRPATRRVRWCCSTPPRIARARWCAHAWASPRPSTGTGRATCA